MFTVIFETENKF